ARRGGIGGEGPFATTVQSGCQLFASTKAVRGRAALLGGRLVAYNTVFDPYGLKARPLFFEVFTLCFAPVRFACCTSPESASTSIGPGCWWPSFRSNIAPVSLKKTRCCCRCTIHRDGIGSNIYRCSPSS